MKINQVYSVLNGIAKQMWGENALTATDLRGVISMGENVLNSNNDKEQFLKVLADRIGSTILRTLDLELDFPNLLRNSFEWGAIIQKINIQPFEAQSQEAWNVGGSGFTPTNFKIDKPVVTQTFFKGANAWEFDVTIPDTMLKTAFTSAEAFGAFVDGIMSALSDSMTYALNNMSYMAIDNFVAEKIKANNGVVDVLAGFNTQAGTSYKTLTEAMDDKEFYRYVGMVTRNQIKYMNKPSKLFNTSDLVRATARDNMHVLISADFMSGYITYLSSDTFHDELVAMPGYEEFVTLQASSDGNGALPTIEGNTSINVVPASNATNDNTAIEATGIIAILADREAIGVGYDDRFTAVDRNNRNRYSNYTSGATIQYFNDVSENGVIIIAPDQSGE